jgi:hypothetical protein
MLKNVFRQVLEGLRGNTAKAIAEAGLPIADGHLLPADTPDWVLHGKNYLWLLERIHEHLQPRTYVEIGVFQGDSIKRIGLQTDAIGIDPSPQIRFPLTQRTRIFALTSDEFFKRHDLRAELGGRKLELGFIDGMHHFEYALRDFINLERCCASDASILIHDGYPLDRATAARQKTTKFWSGDVWRAVLALKKYRPDLAIHTLAAPPTGLCLIRRLDPASRVLSERFDEIVAEFLGFDYAQLAVDKDALLNLMPVGPDTLRALLDA